VGVAGLAGRVVSGVMMFLHHTQSVGQNITQLGAYTNTENGQKSTPKITRLIRTPLRIE
jgi:hypothetical protein